MKGCGVLVCAVIGGVLAVVAASAAGWVEGGLVLAALGGVVLGAIIGNNMVGAP